MGSDRYHPCNEDVEESPSPPELENQEICAEDNGKVDNFVNGHFFVHEQEGSEGVDEREESEEKDFGRFASKFIDFPTSRKIRVVGLFSEVIMMV